MHLDERRYPMDEKIRRAALRATAKVALAMTVVGCLGEVQVEADEANPEESDGPPEEEVTTTIAPPGPQRPEPGVETELACEAPGPDDEVALDPEQLDCCNALLAPVLPSEPDAWPAWIEAAAAPDVQGCCRVELAHFEADPGGTVVPWDTVSPCCEALEFPVGVACTPWGPAVPPAVLGELPLLLPLVVGVA